jgi:hypothetical protein
MKIKYRSGYAEGGFLDDGASVDPISGNEVPTGSLQEEVRDDIPAQLSEGEFVFPADVVRFIGLSQLMKMRDKAKTGLVDMESEGQIGGSPAPQAMPMEMGMGSMQEEPMDIDSMIDGMEGEGGDSLGFAEGGVATFASLMGHEFGSAPTTKNAVYINAAGNKVFIPIIEGEPAYAPPEGYELVVDEADTEVVETPEEELEEAAKPVTNNQANQDYAKGGREKQAAASAASSRFGRDRYNKLESMASSNMNQDEINNFYSNLTTQEKSIYQDRLKDPDWMDGVLTEGMAPVDRMLAAVQTAGSINDRKGLSLNKSQDSTYSDEPIDIPKMMKVMAGALIGGIPGLMSVAQVKKEGVDSPAVLEAAKEYIKNMAMSGLSQGSGREGNEDTQPTNTPAPTEYNQAYWKDNFYDKKDADGISLGKNSAAIAAEQLRIARETGKNAYGNDLTPAEIRNLNKLADAQDMKDKADRTIAAREVQAASDAAAAANIVSTRNEKADMYGGGDNSSGGDGEGQRQRDAEAGKGFGQGNANKDSEEEGQTDYGFMNQGGLASKKKQPIKKMRKDPTSGLAAKKKSKQNAKAKKGALAAKRT